MNTTPKKTRAYIRACTFFDPPLAFIDKPFPVAGGWLATNGRVAVWLHDPEMPKSERWVDVHAFVERTICNINNLISIENTAPPRQFIPPKPPEICRPTQCEWCEGYGSEPGDCKCCGGTGYFDCHDQACTADHECNTCGGAGNRDGSERPLCAVCDGEGVRWIETRSIYADVGNPPQTTGRWCVVGIPLGYVREVNAALGPGTVWRFSRSNDHVHLASGPNGAAVVVTQLNR